MHILPDENHSRTFISYNLSIKKNTYQRSFQQPGSSRRQPCCQTWRDCHCERDIKKVYGKGKCTDKGTGKKTFIRLEILQSCQIFKGKRKDPAKKSVNTQILTWCRKLAGTLRPRKVGHKSKKKDCTDRTRSARAGRAPQHVTGPQRNKTCGTYWWLCLSVKGKVKRKGKGKRKGKERKGKWG